MKQFLVIVITALILAGSSCAQTPIPAKKAVGKDTTAVKAKPKTKKKPAQADTLKPKEVKLPKLVDLGAGKCIPCKMMAPILEELDRDYQGQLEVVFIDVWKNSSAGDKYNIRVIPTQIFFSHEGKELFRHEGFYSKEDILAKWKEHGYVFATKEKK